MKINITDGGRSQYFKNAQVGDGVTRALALARNLDYMEAYNAVKKAYGKTPRNGVSKKATHKVMEQYGGKWHAVMKIGTGCKVHMRENELPHGTIVCLLSGHVACVKNGVLFDNHDCSRGGTRCVYGYWTF